MSPRRILVVQTAYLGDLVLTTPLLDELRRRWPAASVHLVTTDGAARLLATDPRVDSIDSYLKRQSPAGVASFVRLVRRVRELRPDAAIAAQRSWRSGLLVRASGARRRVGFCGAAGSWAYTRQIPWLADWHQAARYAALASGLDDLTLQRADSRPLIVARVGAGSVEPDLLPALPIAPQSLRNAENRLRAVGIATGEPWLCLAPGSARATKRWPTRRFAALARRAAERGLRSCLIGAPGEESLEREILEAARGARPASLIGRVPLDELPAVISRSAGLVGNDSAPAHIAAAVGIPLVALFGPTDPRHGYAPRGPAVKIVASEQLSCRPCSPRGPRRCPRGDLACLTTLEVSAVFDAVYEQIGRSRPARLSTVS